MKKNILFIMLALFAATSATFANELEVKATKSIIKPIQIHINFTVASPRSECVNFPGVCRMTGGILLGKVATGLNCNGNASYESGALTIEILYSDMSDVLMSDFNRITSFPIDTPLPLDPSLLRSLGAPTDAVLQVGKNLIIKDLDRLKLILILK